MSEELNQGDLVVTKEGYFALVLFQMKDDIGVFLCNGIATVEDRADLTVQTILDGPSRANFKEVMLEVGLRGRWLLWGRVFTVERPGGVPVEQNIHEFVDRHLITGEALHKLALIGVGQSIELALSDFDPAPVSSLPYTDKSGVVILRRTD